jgi:hypothetical protein
VSVKQRNLLLRHIDAQVKSLPQHAASAPLAVVGMKDHALPYSIMRAAALRSSNAWNGIAAREDK